ncbi:hypothetical protein GCM10011529_03760 [Polymorphobacter glacialis]|uniref:Uncharacterized protein n=1 Tax=Sandarakinorhabdus glacialis TaxID=1614636 RepID=A0A916ZJJ8_9SPHN|nr:DUF6356 family protein [Polymorphobacter glacialis]GGE00731.1 hypothetical protein GCM10011529_03760 [Polymorphobacter glacialis]
MIDRQLDRQFARLFVDHPRAVNETYLEHMAASFTVAVRLAAAAFKCVVHAFVPGLCKTAGSDAIFKLHGEISPRRFDQPTL